MKKELKEDISKIGDPSLLNSEVQDLQKRVEDHISPVLRYACQHWLTHPSRSSPPDESMMAALKEFAPSTCYTGWRFLAFSILS
jgi:hypothetical protein